MEISEIQTRIENLPLDDQNLIYKQLVNLVNDLDIDISQIQSSQKASESRHCPHCQSSHTVKNGKEHGVQRFLCRSCKRCYRVTTGTFNARMRKGKGELLKLYMKSLLGGDSIRKSASKCKIAVPTSFQWRHRILAALQTQQTKVILDGIVESDDIFLPYSQKGQRNIERKPRKRGKGIFEPKKRGISDEKVAIIISQDRKSQKHLQVATRGRISEKNIEEVLDGKLSKNSILCTDSHPSYIAYAKTNKIEHKTIKATAKQYIKEGKYHIQHVNQTANEMKKWLDNFNGVATKYLQNYLNWFAVLKRIETAQIPLRELSIMICASFDAIKIIKAIPNLSYI
ncbi:MAG: IS1595 family transposase [Saprospiraceae bacterium]|jgi:transposase-like protein|nr:IS1595 family transposase [Saprospiraceae bacterium]